jgi:hypothetical protein
MKRSSISTAVALAAVLIVAGASLGPPALAQTGMSAQAAQLSEDTVRALQRALSEQGFAVAVDGVLDEATAAAIRRYQGQHHLPVTGEPDAATLGKLGVREPRSEIPGDSSRTGMAAAPGGRGGMSGGMGMGGGMAAPGGMMGQGMMGGQGRMPGMMGSMAGEGTPQGGMMGMAPGPMPMMGGGMMMPGGMMMCPMMAAMMGMHPGMMSMAPGAMGMMGPHGMGPGMYPGMMGGMGRDRGAMGLGFGVVRPIQHLSLDDVRHHFEHRLERMGNPRLALGEVTEADETTIVAEIVTVDGSLVDRLSVDRHTGRIERAP